MAEVMKLLEVEPASSSAATPGPDIPSLREQLAILVSTGKYKEAIGVNLTHDQVKRLEDRDVMRHYKGYETYVGAKTTETLIESFLSFLTHDQVKRLEDRDVMRHYKGYETYVGAKTTETLIESFLSLSTKALGMFMRLKDVGALQNELKTITSA